MLERYCFFETWVPLFFVILGGCGLSSAEIYFEKGAPRVKLSNGGLLSGAIDYSREGRPFSSFLGVPYGQIPGRFEDADFAPVWDGLFNASQDGPVCSQAVEFDGLFLPSGPEDCLNLNVFVPMNNTEEEGGLPVMVVIHGGAYSAGSGNMFGLNYFLDEDILLVSFNYRVGVFGFLSTGDEAIPGNSGMKDMILALKWVQKHIRNFGGDPGRVTIAGVSSGGSAVHYLYLSPASEGLFQGAIAQSGSAFAAWGYNPTPKATAVKLANYLGCPTEGEEPKDISSQEISACLRALPMEELNQAQLKFKERWPPKYAAQFDFVPVTEPPSSPGNPHPFMTESPWRMTTTEMKTIPIMTGMTEDEGAFYSAPILQDRDLLRELNSKWEEIILGAVQLDRHFPEEEQNIVANKIKQFYFGDKGVSLETRDNLTNLFSDVMFVFGGRRAALGMARKAPTYLYQYTYRFKINSPSLFRYPCGEEEAKKIAHGDDFVMLVDFGKMIPYAKNLIEVDSSHEYFSKDLVRLHANFVKNGKPDPNWFTGGKGTVEWMPISEKEAKGKNKAPLKWYRIDSPPEYFEEGAGLTERAQFWEKLYREHSYNK